MFTKCDFKTQVLRWLLFGASWRSRGITPVTMKHCGFPSGSPTPPPSPRTPDSAPLPHLNLLPPICLQLKNQFVRCFSLCSAVASSFNLQGHLNPHKSKHSNQTSPLFKMSCHRWGTNRTPWLIGQFKRKMAKRENDISRERPLRQRHGDATVALSSCYGKGFPFNTCFIELFYLENPRLVGSEKSGFGCL